MTVIRQYKRYPLLLALALLFLLTGMIVYMAVQRTGGHFCYALDDPFIHMSIAKNFSTYGVWGVTKYGFTSATSSPLYTLLLSGFFRLFPGWLYLSLLLNLLSAIAVLVISDFFLRKEGTDTGVTAIALTGIALFTPFPILIMGGMEHLLQLLLTIVFLYYSSRFLSTGIPGARTRHDLILLLLSGPLLASVRYEGLFLIFVSCLFMLFQRRIGAAFLVGFISLLPLAVFGYVSVRHGQFWLPNSVLIKGRHLSAGSLHDIFQTLNTPFQRLFRLPWLLVPFLVCSLFYILLFRQGRSFRDRSCIMILLYQLTLLQHLLFAGDGWAYRYESYLVGTGVFIIAILWKEALPSVQNGRIIRQWPVIALSVLLLIPLMYRSYSSMIMAVNAPRDIYSQNVQIGRFLGRYYSGHTVAFVDLGAENYFSETKIVDIAGLATSEITGRILKKTCDSVFTNGFIRAKGVTIAVMNEDMYKLWFSGPPPWKKIADWKLKYPIIYTAYDKTSFYAVNPVAADSLAGRLRQFERDLPGDVSVDYYR